MEVKLKIETRITKLFGIGYPIMLSGMSWISTPELVAAVSNAGCLGMLATGPLSPKETRHAVREIRGLTDKPFGANVTLLFPGARENAEVLLEEKVPIINFALGKGDWIVREAHKYGGKVVATVATLEHAKKAEDFGVDALVVTGHEASAHGSDITSLVLIRAVARIVSIPIIAAGGFSDGSSLVAALALGADGVAMGVRFMMTKESPLHQNFKKLGAQKSVHDTLYSSRFDGLPSRVMKTTGAIRQMKRGLGFVGVVKALINARKIARSLEQSYLKMIIDALRSGLKRSILLAYTANSFEHVFKATVEGNTRDGILPTGQAIGLIEDIPPVSEVVKSIVSEATLTVSKLLEMFSTSPLGGNQGCIYRHRSAKNMFMHNTGI